MSSNNSYSLFTKGGCGKCNGKMLRFHEVRDHGRPYRDIMRKGHLLHFLGHQSVFGPQASSITSEQVLNQALYG